EPVPGNTVVLTIDKNIQKAAINALEKEIKHLNETAPEGKGKEADAGAVVVIDIKSSEILAAVTNPSYDLSVFNETFAENNMDKRAPFLNRAFNGIYAPGSCFKPVTGTAALSEGLANEETKVVCTGVYTALAALNYQPTCLSAHGAMRLEDALRASCNIYFYDMGRQLGIPKINEYAKKLGLGVKTGIELSETAGTLNNPDTKNPGDALQAAIGQLDNGFSPLQLANYTAILARNGVKKDLTLIKGISSTYDIKDLKPYEKNRPTVDSGIPRENFEIIRKGMIAATHDIHGTAYSYLGDYPLTVACKTGTPETKEFPNSTFICYAPAEDPQIAIAVVIEKGWHGYTGAPVARAIMDAYFFPEKAAADALEAEKLEAEKNPQEEKE
ncbi:MAG: penicillin-binding transpeptidase domain-containing protein, partial [Oscillospiraceae bacterium]